MLPDGSVQAFFTPDDAYNMAHQLTALLPAAIILAGIAALFGGIISGAKTLRKFQKMNEQEELWTNAK